MCVYVYMYVCMCVGVCVRVCVFKYERIGVCESVVRMCVYVCVW